MATHTDSSTKRRPTRDERVEAHMRDPDLQRRDRRLRAYGIVVVSAVVALLVVTAFVRKSVHQIHSAADLQGRSAIASELRGIPQSGTTLGSSVAPVSIEEFADPQCSVCGEFAHDSLPKLVRDEIRTGRARLTYRPLVLLGPDSRLGSRAVLAAASQGRAWQFIDVFYDNQGPEQSGYVTQRYLDIIAQGSGVDVSRFEHDRLDSSSAYDVVTDAAAADAERDHFDTPPSFLVTGPHGSRRVTDGSLRSVEQAVDAVH